MEASGGYVVAERSGAFIKLVRDPALSRDSPTGRALGRMLAALLQTNQLLVAERSPDEVFECLLESVLELTKAQVAYLHRLDIAEDSPGAEPMEDAGPSLRCLASLSGQAAVGARPEASMSIVREVLSTGRAVLTYDAASDERFEGAQSVVGQRIRSAVCVPLIVDQSPVGSLYVANGSAPGLLTSRDLGLIEALAEQAAVAVEMARLQADNRQLTAALRRQLDAQTEELEVVRSRLDEQEEERRLRYRYDQIVHRSEGMRRVLELVDRVVDSDMPVLIVGESGTGKELLARAIHYNGARKRRAFVPVNCGAVSPHLFESEFFGHVKGAFTGADRNRKGHFEVASGGTLFLDELGELDLAMQVKLLRALQEREVMPVGSSVRVPVDVRIVAATNQRLEAMLSDGRFREDLYYRIGVVRLDVPPLRERKDDIPALVERFAEGLGRGGRPLRIPKATLVQLERYHWPGNVRELENAVSYLSIFVDRGLDDIPLPFARAAAESGRDRPVASGPDGLGISVKLGTPLNEVERIVLEATLEHTSGNKNQAARLLGIDRSTLYRKLWAYEEKE